MKWWTRHSSGGGEGGAVGGVGGLAGGWGTRVRGGRGGENGGRLQERTGWIARQEPKNYVATTTVTAQPGLLWVDQVLSKLP